MKSLEITKLLYLSVCPIGQMWKEGKRMSTDWTINACMYWCKSVFLCTHYCIDCMTQAMLTRIHKSFLSPNFIFAAWRDAGPWLCFANYAYQSVSTSAPPRPIRVSGRPTLANQRASWGELCHENKPVSTRRGCCSQCLVHHQGVLLKSKSEAIQVCI